jgi:hypothetical protein
MLPRAAVAVTTGMAREAGRAADFVAAAFWLLLR